MPRSPDTSPAHPRKPSWLLRPLRTGRRYADVARLLDREGLHTVCRESRCPNLGECFSRGTATFLILGPHCTRACRFCSVSHGDPVPPRPGEPAAVARAVLRLGLSHAVVTSVTRDDLPDGGAGHFAATAHAIRNMAPAAGIEVLTPDFLGDPAALRTVMDAAPDIIAHNIETVPRLYPAVRPGADYRRSLNLLRGVHEGGITAKSGIMLGLGEEDVEVEGVLGDLYGAGCRSLTLGQYLQPSGGCVSVARYVHPDEFADWRGRALAMGFERVMSGPYVRSSYRAGEEE